ncbi:MAG: molybdopterin-dependent oxidoreductase, partial [Rhodocyclaceae bacterium]|nr:molybdopterin-dependent oxidoreductase [Rhodocyclaceae bacterium]
DKVLRVLPLENEDINECWLSDKDRFSYEALNSEERLTKPMVKQGGQWVETEWNVALDYIGHALRDVVKNHGADAIGTLVSPHSTLEEIFLAQKLTRALGSGNVDFRLRQSDFSLDGKRAGTPWLGLSVAEFSKLDRVLVVGSFLRKDHPLLAQRLRQAAKRGTQVSLINAADDDQLIKNALKAVGLPSQLPKLLAEVVKAVAGKKGANVDAAIAAVTVSAAAEKIAESLVSGGNTGVFLGNFAQQHPQAAMLEVLAQQLAALLGGKSGFLGEAANSVGGYVAKATPTGLNAAQMFAQPRKAYLVFNAEPELDAANGAQAAAALKDAAMVAVFSAFKSDAALEYADVLLPIAPFTETSGTFINTEGRVQSFNAVAKALGEARPGWKVLRVLGNVLDLAGFDYNSSEDVRNEVLGGDVEFATGLNNGVTGTVSLPAAANGVERVADVPIYFADSLVRRAVSLQRSRDASTPAARISAVTAAKLGLDGANEVTVKQGGAEVKLALKIDASVPEGAVRVAAAHEATIALGSMFGQISVERA